MSKIFPEYQTSMSSIINEDEQLERSPNKEDFVLPVVSEHRMNSYRMLMSNPSQRYEFIELFFTNIFNIESKDKLKNMMAKAVADPRNSNDNDVYLSLKKQLENTDGPGNQIMKIWKSITQTRRQRRELVKETVTILHRLKRLGKINGFASIGDTGKLVRELTENKFVSGKVWVVHDSLGGIPQMLERGSELEVGEFVAIDYKNPVSLGIPTNSVDLVTLNQGLHHFPQEAIIPFLQEVKRVLRVGGLFMVREHDAVPDLIPVLDLAHSVFNAVTGVSEVDEREEIRGFRPILEWRRIIESVGLTDSYLYEMEHGDPTIDEMMCYFKESTAKTESPEVTSETEVEKCEPKLDGVFPAKIEAAIQTIATNGPDMLIEVAKNSVNKAIVLMRNIIENLKLSKVGFTKGQQFLAQQLLSQVLNPIIEMLTAFQPYLDEAKTKEADFELIPEELIVLVKALLNKAKDGKASPAELILVGIITDIQDFLSTSPDDEDLEETDNTDISKDEVERVMERLLLAMPELTDLNNLEYSDFNHSSIMLIQSQLGKSGKSMNAKSITDTLFPFLDSYSWTRLSQALEEIIQDPKSNKFLLANITDKRSSWWHATMGLLSGRSVKFNNYGATMASMIGLGPLIEMWQVAQKCRSQDEQNGDPIVKTKLSTKSRNMLASAAHLMTNDKGNEEASLEALLRCLRLAGVVKKKGSRPEFTWFKLVEWLQVEYVEIFGSFMHHQPWYQFPFGKMLTEYFSILFNEVKIVFKNHGMMKACLSGAFLTDFIPGVVMSVLFGQLASMALPIRAVLGDEYSPDKLASQFEELVVTSNKTEVNEWREVDEEISAEKLVDGLFILKVPSLGKFTDALIHIALECEDTRILTISDHTEVQMKVSIAAHEEEFARIKTKIQLMAGVSFKFDYKLPTIGKDPKYELPQYVAFGIKTHYLLSAIRAISSMDSDVVHIDQIYDFWTE